MSIPIYEMGSPNPVGYVEDEIIDNTWECGHCGYVGEWTPMGSSGTVTVKHKCPDGHIEDRFRAARGVSDHVFEEYRQKIIRSQEVKNDRSATGLRLSRLRELLSRQTNQGS